MLILVSFWTINSTSLRNKDFFQHESDASVITVSVLSRCRQTTMPSGWVSLFLVGSVPFNFPSLFPKGSFAKCFTSYTAGHSIFFHQVRFGLFHLYFRGFISLFIQPSWVKSHHQASSADSCQAKVITFLLTWPGPNRSLSNHEKASAPFPQASWDSHETEREREAHPPEGPPHPHPHRLPRKIKLLQKGLWTSRTWRGRCTL